MITYALKVAQAAHNGQVDKGGEPYYQHVLRVWKAVSFEPIEVQVAAILHDTVEDTSVTVTGIRNKFGREIAEAVDALTRRKGAETYDQYIKRLAHNPIAVRVKKADLLDNMRPERVVKIPQEKWGLVQRYQRALNYLNSL